MKPYPRALNSRPRLDIGRTTRNRKRKKSRFSVVAIGVIVTAAFIYGGIVVSGGTSSDSATAVSTSAKVVASTMTTSDTRPSRSRHQVAPGESLALRGTSMVRTPVLSSERGGASPRGAASGIRRGEILPGERLESALRRMGIAQGEIRRLVKSLVTVFDAADSHAGDTFIAQTDSAGAVLWFELRTLRGVSVGARRQDADLVAYRIEKMPGPGRPVTGSSAHAAARNG